MAGVYDAAPQELIAKASKELAKNPVCKAPEWAQFAKTGAHKERQPDRLDWWHTRLAAVLRTVYMRGPVGVSKLSVKYGGAKNKGAAPSKFVRGSRNVLRTSLQQLEAAGLVAQAKTGRKGRIVTAKGKSFLDKLTKE
ncbi:30S ribosomal protein S19e [Candidatus Woesearchaeota archaeon CG_4_10_14_0_2_um_filter_57_5]|nr:MAG: 30S ribosomal protein S19e [Candidatus Woesearchaeota archaeon CG1_02_57_44]PIN69401.1 MAG: 30S ribosomal protein S19e [Candidatus Woesearchaeota archaeon CG11_big_fil_rev_8_21_14_0_20_57_5]PIZ55567.1 MAG: 30S ribosomal protein S19e [Candidatus Woesearchaeota archaeon CG_4_10_14_0_2_um_filter_57_5]